MQLSTEKADVALSMLRVLGRTSSRRSPMSRVPLERMVLIHQALQGRGRVTAPTLAASMEIATKTVYRDLDFMRDRLRLPIAWDFKERSYRIQIGKDQP